MAHRLTFFIALGAACTVPGQALAVQDSASLPERVQIVYHASGACPASAAFNEEVAARVRRPVEWVQQDAATFIRVEVALSGEGATGSLEIAQTGGTPTRREFEAATCAEVSSALALVVALALDPNANTEPLVAEAPPPPPPATRDTASVPESKARAASPRARFYVGPATGASGGYAPTALVTLGAMLGVRSTRGDWFSPLLQLTPLWGKTGTTGPESTNANFTWALVRVDACPSRLGLSAQLAVVPCISVEAGRVSAAGRSESVDVPDRAVRPWVALGPSLGVRFKSDRWFFALGGSALAPFTRDEYVFLDPRVPVHEVPAVVFGGLLGLGLEL